MSLNSTIPWIFLGYCYSFALNDRSLVFLSLFKYTCVEFNDSVSFRTGLYGDTADGSTGSDVA
jgi:hypothetical protein